MSDFHLKKREEFLSKLEERIRIGKELLNRIQQGESYGEDEWYHWHEENTMFIKNYFDPPENEVTRKYFNKTPSPRTLKDAIAGMKNGDENEVLDRLSKLQLVKKLTLMIDKEGKTDEVKNVDSGYHPTKVFIVHGHDKGLRSEVARVIGQLNLEPIILNEQVNRGQTIIEKFETNSDVGYAIILLTPDDFGGIHGGEPNPRARQNVIFEMGYFYSKLGRNRVFNLIKENVEQPSDLDGILYNPYKDGWQYRLGKELMDLGYQVDLSKI